MQSGGKALLVIGHPGHELRVHGWLSQEHPDVAVLTDGSGRMGHSRLESTRRLLADAGSRPAPFFGACTDRQLYDALLAGDRTFFGELGERLLQTMRAGEYRLVVGDASEGYNPAHDICRVLIDACVAALRQEGREVASFSFAVVGPMQATHAGTSFSLDDAAYARKLAAAGAYIEMKEEVERALSVHGADSMRHEHFMLADDAANRSPALPPEYETYGERRQAAGLYQDVVRYHEHFEPAAQAIRDTLRACTLVSRS